MRDKGYIEKELGEILNYIQPIKYIVNSTDYDDSYKTPVLTPGKSFIKGYTNETEGIFIDVPTIIFDDFTTASKYVNFPFKVKSSAMKILVAADDQIDIKYVFYMMQVIQVRSDTHKRYWISVFSKKKLLLPPLPEQHRILAKFEELFSELDAGVESLKKAKEQLKTYRQAVLKAAFEGKLTESPNDWSTKEVHEIAKVGTGATPLRSKNEYWTNGDIPWITSGALNDPKVVSPSEYITQQALNETNCKIIPKHSLLIALYGEGKTRGKCSELELEYAATNQAIASLTFDEQGVIHKDFVKWFFQKNYEDIRRLSSGGVQPNLNLGIIKRTKIPWPNASTQNAIIQEIESRLSVCDNLEQTIELELKQSESLRQSILKRAFEGRLV